MKKLLNVCLLLMMVLSASAQGQGPRKGGGKHQGDNRQEWMQKMKEFKHSYLVKELDLSEKQAEDFFKSYDAKEKERFDAERKVRELERTVSQKGNEATEAELEACIEAQYQLSKTMADIDAKYEKDFRAALTKRQLCKLPHVEREFQRMLMEKRNDCPPPPHKQ